MVKIDIANLSGSSKQNPEKFFIDNKIPLDLPVVQDIIEVQKKTPLHPSGLRGALLTGPVYIEGAEPGDMLEVRVLDVRFRAPYGVNSTSPGGGHPLGGRGAAAVDAQVRPRPRAQCRDLQAGRDRAAARAVLRPDGRGSAGRRPVRSAPVRQRPCMVATSTCRSSRAAARCILPVNVPGALFFTGQRPRAAGERRDHRIRRSK